MPSVQRFGINQWNSFVSPTRFHVFAWLWCGGMMIHMNQLLEFLEVDDYYLFLLTLVFFLLPNFNTFFFLVLMQVMVTGIRMGNIANHWFFALLCGILLLMVFTIPYLTQKILSDEDEDSLFDQLVPVLRIMLVVLYFFTAFHKFNSGFLSTEHSCVVTLYSAMENNRLFFPLPDLTQISASILIGVILLLETLVFVLLAIPKTWFWGILTGTLFHFSIAPLLIDFPMFGFAIYWLFIPRDVARKLIATLESKLLQMGVTYSLFGVYRTVLFVILFPLLLRVFAPSEMQDLLRRIGNHLWMFFVVIAAVWFVSQMVRNNWHRVQELHRFRIQSKILLVVPVLLVFQGISPYLGLRTTTAMTMFSNLRTEHGISNHLLIRKRLSLAHYQDDLVEIIETNNPHMQGYIDNEYLLTWVMFRRYIQGLAVQGQKGIDIIYKRNSQTYSVSNAELDPVLMQQENFFQKTMLAFRPVEKDGRAVRCAW